MAQCGGGGDSDVGGGGEEDAYIQRLRAICGVVWCGGVVCDVVSSDAMCRVLCFVTSPYAKYSVVVRWWWWYGVSSCLVPSRLFLCATQWSSVRRCHLMCGYGVMVSHLVSSHSMWDGGVVSSCLLTPNRTTAQCETRRDKTTRCGRRQQHDKTRYHITPHCIA